MHDDINYIDLKKQVFNFETFQNGSNKGNAQVIQQRNRQEKIDYEELLREILFFEDKFEDI